MRGVKNIMGNWGISKKEMVEVMAKGLDSLAGDFTKHDLLMALIKLKEYPYVSDKIIDDKDWRNYLNIDEVKYE